METQMDKRIKSFLWRGGMIGVLATVNFFVENASGLGLGSFWVVLIGLVGGELTKYLNR